MQKKWMQKESVSKQGRKTVKSKPTAHKDQDFDDLDDFDAIDYMEIEDARNEKGVSTEDQVSTAKPDEGTDKSPKKPQKLVPTRLMKGLNKLQETFAHLGNDEDIASKGFKMNETLIAFYYKALQERKREKFTIKERAILLHDTIIAQSDFFTTKMQLKIRGKKHSDLKTKNFEEIQVLYEKKDASKEDEITRKRKLGTRKKMKSRKRRFRQDTFQDDQTDSKKENEELRLCLTIATDEDKEVDYEIFDKKYHIIECKTEYLGTKPQFDETKRLEEINLNVVIRSNGQRRYFSTLMRVLSIFDREDINVVYQLVMDGYQDEIPEEDSTMALELIRFVKKLIAKLEPEDSDGNDKGS
ncbi:hypothetical protein Tco_1144072 [Tanacetum coccineum]